MDKQAEAALKRAIGMMEAILTRQVKLHRDMLELADAKRESIIKGDLEQLEKAVSGERRLIAEIEDEERRRLAVMPLLRNALGLPDSVDRLLDVIDAMPQAEQQGILPVRNELKEVLEAVQQKTRHNAELLKASLEHVEAFLRTIAEASSGSTGYTKDGKRSGGGPSIIDRSI